MDEMTDPDALRWKLVASVCVEALKEALWTLDNVAAVLSAKGIESTMSDPTPAIRNAVALAEKEAAK